MSTILFGIFFLLALCTFNFGQSSPFLFDLWVFTWQGGRLTVYLYLGGREDLDRLMNVICDSVMELVGELWFDGPLNRCTSYPKQLIGLIMF